MPSKIKLLLFLLGLVCKVTSTTKAEDLSLNPIIQKFREYVQIDTSKQENIYQAVEFWRREATSAGLAFRVVEPAGKPICIISLQGTDPSLPSIMLNSHMDVVPAEVNDWTYPPFSAHMDESGNIFGRGTQDDKDVSIQYFEALKILRRSDVPLRRTLHITLMPDEEIGGFAGIQSFINTTEFKHLNVGFALDEGLSSADDVMLATYVDKRPWQMRFIIRGTSGHGSSIAGEPAMVKASTLLSKVMAFREVQKIIQISLPTTDYGGYATVNVNAVHGGEAANVIPSEVNVTVDMRLPTNAELQVYESMVQSWLSDLGDESEVEYLKKVDVSPATAVDDSNPYWSAMMEAAKELGITIKPVVCPATSDMVVVRNYGIPAIGFSPKFNTTTRMHGADEYLNAETLIRGVGVFVAILKKLGNLQ